MDKKDKPRTDSRTQPKLQQTLGIENSYFTSYISWKKEKTVWTTAAQYILLNPCDCLYLFTQILQKLSDDTLKKSHINIQLSPNWAYSFRTSPWCPLKRAVRLKVALHKTQHIKLTLTVPIPYSVSQFTKFAKNLPTKVCSRDSRDCLQHKAEQIVRAKKGCNLSSRPSASFSLSKIYR